MKKLVRIFFLGSLFFAIVFSGLKGFDGQFKVKAQTVIRNQNTTCTNAEVAWGEWCVFYGLDTNNVRNTEPYIVIKDFVNIYHAAPWYRDGKLNMMFGGWRTSTQQHDTVFRAQTSDPFGISGWEIVKNSKGGYAYVDNYFETPNSTDLPSDVTQDRNGDPVVVSVNGETIYRSHHTIQPDILPAYKLPGNVPCCDMIYYSYDYLGLFPETKVGVHYAFLDQQNNLLKASSATGKNPVLDWHTYDGLGGRRVRGTSDQRVTYDPKTQKYYMVFGEWTYDETATMVSSIAVSDTPTGKFKIVARDVFNGDCACNPYILVGPDGKYYYFHTNYSELKVSVADSITGPYTPNTNRSLNGERFVLTPPSTMKVPGTPYVFCNTSMNQWQMYFSAGKSITQNQIYTAFLHQPCSTAPLYSGAVSPTEPPVIGLCTRKREGDADCDGDIDLLDFDLFRKEFNRELTTLKADFNANGTVDLIDFEALRATLRK